MTIYLIIPAVGNNMTLALSDINSYECDAPKISIIILNWNNWRDTLDCLHSLHQITYPCYHVIIVDNGSTDSSLEKIRAHYAKASSADLASGNSREEAGPACTSDRALNGTKPECEPIGNDGFEIRGVTLVRNEENRGYAEGNNVGIRLALKRGSDAVVLLNNDTIVDPQFLTELVKAYEHQSSAGFFGPKVYYSENKGRKDVISFAGGIFRKRPGRCYPIGKNEVDKGQFDAIREVDYVEGSCLMVRAEVIDKIGLLDPTFFAYWEDVDWCVRGKRAGYTSIYVPGARVWHKISAGNVGKANIYFMARNRFWFMRRHLSPLQYRLFFLYFFTWPFWQISASLVFYRRSLLSLQRFWLGTFHGACRQQGTVSYAPTSGGPSSLHKL
jgi:GT2 family glycosyltransferase